MIGDWSNFCLGELGAAAALAGLLFVSVSVNQARILQLGSMADRGLEALAMLLLVVVVASLPLVPGQPLRLLGAEILVIATITLFVAIRLQLTYLQGLKPEYRPQSMRMVTECTRRPLLASGDFRTAIRFWVGRAATMRRRFWQGHRNPTEIGHLTVAVVFFRLAGCGTAPQ
jgi:hypothetical protein